MALADDLKELGDLHQSGVITSEEFKLAKAKLLTAEVNVPATSAPAKQISSELADLDKAWEIEKQKYYLDDGMGNRVPQTLPLKIIGGLQFAWSVGCFVVVFVFFSVGLALYKDHSESEQSRKVGLVVLGLLASGALVWGFFSFNKGLLAVSRIFTHRAREMEYLRKRERLD